MFSIYWHGLRFFSGLKINLGMYEIFEVNIVEEWVPIIELWGCKKGEFSVLHLVLPRWPSFGC